MLDGLPSIAALRSFEAAVRHGSFSRAGAEIGLTQSAVSRQIALLESWLKLSLFDRRGRRVELNEAGRSYAEEVLPALNQIRRASRRLIERRDSTLSIATLPSFGMRWLAPRLPLLTARHSELVVNFAARSEPFDFGLEDFDAAIHFGLPGEWPRVAHDFLFREEAVPVCSPEWLSTNPLAEPADLLHVPLLSQTSRRDAWSRWFESIGLEGSAKVAGPTFEHFLMLAQASAAGMGVALIPSFLIRPELEAGTLVIPFAYPLSSENGYYLVYPEVALERNSFVRFRSWLLDMAQVSQNYSV